ncbi:hypothetical protein JK358_33280 [Nocardia sp. 2]|uniref:Lipoprotein n=1 Tax=Nocardia acididurans TaxID=2802282 RepID=A0ABS1MGX6_9NOCA|nr:hypothetical protein [Nocardia acididurans]MBL1079290.1 hypothetical protein [Nocardia acididurans]
MRTALTLATLSAVSLVAACSGSPSETNPASTTTSARPAIYLDEASRIVAENFTMIWPEPISLDVDRIKQNRTACHTNPATLMPEGPPWIPSTSATVFNPSQEFVDKALANLEAMTTKGFVLQPYQVPGEDPINRTYKDERGFTIGAHRDTGTSPRGVMFTMSSAAPCVDEQAQE